MDVITGMDGITEEEVADADVVAAATVMQEEAAAVAALLPRNRPAAAAAPPPLSRPVYRRLLTVRAVRCRVARDR